VSETSTEIKDGLLVVQQTQGGGRTRLALQGELDLANAATLDLALREALDLGQEVVVDMRDLEFLDSTGISLLVIALQGPHAERLSFIPSSSPEVRRLLEMTGLDQRLGFSSAPPRAPA
jgi:anti-sigma B factor antagonist